MQRDVTVQWAMSVAAWHLGGGSHSGGGDGGGVKASMGLDSTTCTKR